MTRWWHANVAAFWWAFWEKVDGNRGPLPRREFLIGAAIWNAFLVSLVAAFLWSSRACAQDAGISDVPRALAPASSVHVLPDGGVAPTVRGCWFDSPTCIDMARERVELQERVRLAERKQVQSPLPDLAVAYSAGVVTGVVVTLAIVGVMAASKLGDP